VAFSVLRILEKLPFLRVSLSSLFSASRSSFFFLDFSYLSLIVSMTSANCLALNLRLLFSFSKTLTLSPLTCNLTTLSSRVSLVILRSLIF
jgi:hypothetical protein